MCTCRHALSGHFDITFLLMAVPISWIFFFCPSLSQHVVVKSRIFPELLNKSLPSGISIANWMIYPAIFSETLPNSMFSDISVLHLGSKLHYMHIVQPPLYYDNVS